MAAPCWCLWSALAASAVAAGAGPSGGGAPPPQTAVVSVRAPAALAGNYVVRFPGDSSRPGESREFIAVFPADVDGCSAYGAELPRAGDTVAVVRNSSCSLAQKASRAAAAGAKGLVVISGSEDIDGLWAKGSGAEPGVFVIGIQQSLGRQLRAWSAHDAGAQGGLRMSFAVYVPMGLLDPSQLLLVCLASALVAAGAFFSTADLRLGSPIAPGAGEVVEMDRWFPLMFCGMGSCMLVVLYFLMKYLIYVIIAAFCVGGTTTLTELMHKCLRYCIPALQRRLCTLPLLGPVELAVVLSLPVALAVAMSWFVLRKTSHGWLFQDIIGAAFLCFIQRTLRLPNMKLASALLALMFFFDIFWVFVSPVFFPSSVMVEVATGGGTGEQVPLLLRIPALGDPLGRDRMLGFGDVALPGLLLSFLRRHDVLSHRGFCRGYFGPALAGYFVAMCVTLVALQVMKMGQPALLYLVPGTLGTTLLLAWRRQEVASLWEGAACPGASAARPDAPFCSYCPGGHELRPCPADKGRCDGCGKGVAAGEPVMDCRRCNWYLCAGCRPVGRQAPGGAEAQDLEGALVAP